MSRRVVVSGVIKRSAGNVALHEGLRVERELKWLLLGPLGPPDRLKLSKTHDKYGNLRPTERTFGVGIVIEVMIL